MDTTQLLKECQKKFACSVSLVDVVGGTKGGREVTIQGNFIILYYIYIYIYILFYFISKGNFGPETESMLIEMYGIPKALIDIRISKGIKPKH
jgi:hypothetical protein